MLVVVFVEGMQSQHPAPLPQDAGHTFSKLFVEEPQHNECNILVSVSLVIDFLFRKGIEKQKTGDYLIFVLKYKIDCIYKVFFFFMVKTEMSEI